MQGATRRLAGVLLASAVAALALAAAGEVGNRKAVGSEALGTHRQFLPGNNGQSTSATDSAIRRKHTGKAGGKRAIGITDDVGRHAIGITDDVGKRAIGITDDVGKGRNDLANRR